MPDLSAEDISNHTIVQGWVDQPDTRGTFDIVWSCLVTIFLCIWSIQCLNIPADNEGQWHVFRRKFRWAAIAILGPEFSMTFANGQWAAAKRSVKYFRESGHKDWTITHAFFAEMGGFVLQTHKTGKFPISSEQLHYLVEQGQVEYPKITLEEINDKSKGDVWTKTIIGLQTGWFLLEMLGRAITRSPVATLEIATGGFVVCNVATNFFWYFKPQDVTKPITIHLEQAVPWDDPEKEPLSLRRLTPLDFIDNLMPSWSMTVMPHLRMPRTGPQERPMKRLPNDRLPRICGKCQIFICIVTLLYGAAHLVGWNFEFPSVTEKLLWRITSSLQIGMTALFWIADESTRFAQKRFNGPGTMQLLRKEIEEKRLANQKRREAIANNNSVLTDQDLEKNEDPEKKDNAIFQSDSSKSTPDSRRSAADVEAHLPTNPQLNDKTTTGLSEVQIDELLWDMPRWQIVLVSGIISTYLVARAYLIVEVFIGLRSLPAGTFKTIQWTAVIPSFS